VSIAYGDNVVQRYLPDYNSSGRAINRNYLFNVSNHSNIDDL